LNDIRFIFRGYLDTGLISALGPDFALESLLVLWLAGEVDRLKGEEIQSSLFVGVGLMVFIRKGIMAILSHEDIKLELAYPGGIFIFGPI